jgi:16S rRNA (uracil1498-N3)-methyltransferase
MLFVRVYQMKPSQRLYVKSQLSEGAKVALDAGQAHYLSNVLRMGLGEAVLVFNGADGEWIAHLGSASKKGGEVVCVSQTKPQDRLPNLWLLFAPVKGDRTDYIVEKATEFGVVGIVPVITERTIVRKVNLERLQSRCIEAAEQCGRLSVPVVTDAATLSAFYESPSDDGVILFADEAGGAKSIEETFASMADKVALLIGPEGGFTPSERDKLRACAHVRAISLGPRILRADTAAFAALALIQSVWGDWR